MKSKLFTALSIVCALWAALAHADISQTVEFDIAPQGLQEALARYSAQCGVKIEAPAGILQDKASIGVVGRFSAAYGLARILEGTNLIFDIVNEGAVTIRTAPPPAPAPAAAGNTPAQDESRFAPNGTTQITVEAPEPRFAAPTRRDRIGRIWAPVYINGKGPFRLVLDSSASRSGVTREVAHALRLPLDQSPPVTLRGMTGMTEVPTTLIDSMSVGDLRLEPSMVLIVPDALGGAEGVLDMNRFADRRIYVDFRNDEVRFTRSNKERAGRGFFTLPFKLANGKLVAMNARISGVRALAILDTGSQVTVANGALHEALLRINKEMRTKPEEIMGATTHVQKGDTAVVPPIELGPIQINQGSVTFGDMSIFEHWKLTRRPTMLIGMDVIGLFDTFIIDYRRKELQIRMRTDNTLANSKP